jgi:hypothetical protein
LRHFLGLIIPGFDFSLAAQSEKAKNMKRLILFAGLLCLSSLLHAPNANAWGRRGHAIICDTAGTLAGNEPKGEFLTEHTYDLGYYCNIEDFVWKDPATYDYEKPNHFMDMEMFERAFKGSKVPRPFELDRLQFEKAFPSVPAMAGRAFWRIRETEAQMQGFKEKLMAKGLKIETQHELQGDWLLRAGMIGHYVGDLSMPMHVTENFDGQFTNQKGLHGFFEDSVVNYLFHSENSDLETEVYKAAERRWKKDKSLLAKKTVLQLIEDLAMDSVKVLPDMLKMDRALGRTNMEKAAGGYKSLIVSRMAYASVVIAELYRRGIGFNFNNDHFYTWMGVPKYVMPPVAKP